jgi:NAD(P) transhydrogenase subunit beta
MSQFLLLMSYLIGSITFILGLKMLSNPKTARQGNLIAAGGMGIAIVATIFLYINPENHDHLHNYGWIFGGLLIGAVIGTVAARRVKMTAMPEMVSLYNGMGGACAMLISVIEFQGDAAPPTAKLLIIALGALIGTVSFVGSIIAWGKLNGRIKDRRIPGAQIINFALLGSMLLLAVLLVIGGIATPAALFYGILVVATLYGIVLVMPIGGADMPVVISLLNSFTGLAAAFGGFLYDNPVMLTGGILVGSAGTILTILMCKAMNRSLSNVLVGSFGGQKAVAGGGGATKERGTYKEISLNDTATLLAYSQKVMIIPGYGLAVAQAQHDCNQLDKLLTEKGVEVYYGIHPVAGRMPGHMNVLLAEANVPYEKLLEMEDANDRMDGINVVLILGANDVVNPAAKSNPASPIYGMPILEVEKADHVIVNKRSMNRGYADIENELFFAPKTSMLFGDSKTMLQNLIAELKQM